MRDNNTLSTEHDYVQTDTPWSCSNVGAVRRSAPGKSCEEIHCDNPRDSIPCRWAWGHIHTQVTLEYLRTLGPEFTIYSGCLTGPLNAGPEWHARAQGRITARVAEIRKASGGVVEFKAVVHPTDGLNKHSDVLLYSNVPGIADAWREAARECGYPHVSLVPVPPLELPEAVGYVFKDGRSRSQRANPPLLLATGTGRILWGTHFYRGTGYGAILETLKARWYPPAPTAPILNKRLQPPPALESLNPSDHQPGCQDSQAPARISAIVRNSAPPPPPPGIFGMMPKSQPRQPLLAALQALLASLWGYLASPPPRKRPGASWGPSRACRRPSPHPARLAGFRFLTVRKRARAPPGVD